MTDDERRQIGQEIRDASAAFSQAMRSLADTLGKSLDRIDEAIKRMEGAKPEDQASEP